MNHTVKIEKIIHGGQGLGRLTNGMVVLCPQVLPGEIVVARESKQHRGYVQAELVDILEPSEYRVNPPCPYFSRCGGCNFQHIDYQAQLTIKKEIIQEALKRSGVDIDLSLLQPVIPSPEPYSYRYRIRLKLSPAGKLGFYKTRSNSLIRIDRCMIATSRINTALHEIGTSPFLIDVAPFFREIEIMESPADNSVHAIFHVDKNRKGAPELLTDIADPIPHVDHLSIHTGKTCIPVPPATALPLLRQDFEQNISGRPYTLTWSPDCFSQVNAEQNSILVRHVLREIGPVSGQRILDLYCGMGNFSIPLGLKGPGKLTGVEINRSSMAWAETNARMHKLKNSIFIQADVLRQIKRFIGDTDVYDVIVLDPPRQGVGREIHLVADLKPGRILYVSCDPATLIRDMNILTQKGYTIASLTPVDMFPQTHHIESVALLEKN